MEKVCNLWLEPADYRCILSTGVLTPDGMAVMDSGIAKEAAQKFSGIEIDLGRALASRGNHVHEIRPGILNFPIQQFEWSGPDLNIIERSGHELVEFVGEAKALLPRPGGDALSWEDVANVLSFLPDNIVVVQHT